MVIGASAESSSTRVYHSPDEPAEACPTRSTAPREGISKRITPASSAWCVATGGRSPFRGLGPGRRRSQAGSGDPSGSK